MIEVYLDVCFGKEQVFYLPMDCVPEDYDSCWYNVDGRTICIRYNSDPEDFPHFKNESVYCFMVINGTTGLNLISGRPICSFKPPFGLKDRDSIISIYGFRARVDF